MRGTTTGPADIMLWRKHHLFVCLALVQLWSVGCKPKVDSPESRERADLGISQERLELIHAFGRKFCADLTAGEDPPVREAWDVGALWDRIVAGIPVDKRFQDQAKQSFTQAISVEYGTAVRGLMMKRIDLLNAHAINNELRIRCRQLENGGVNYYDFVVVFGADGLLHVIDAYDYGAGEFVSDGMRRTILPQLATLAGVSVADLTGGPEGAAAMDAALRLEGALRGGKFAEVGQLFLSLPEKGRQDKRTLLQVMGAIAAGTPENSPSPEAATEAEKQIASHFADDPAFLLMEIDHRFRAKEFDEVLKTIENLKKAVGGDPYLEAMRASALLAADRLEPAVETALLALEKAPNLPEAGWAAVNAGMKASRWDAVAKGLDGVIKTGVRFDPSEEVMLRPFFKSPEGKAWVQRNASLLTQDPVAPAVPASVEAPPVPPVAPVPAPQP